jgi:hypothetical protein
MIMKIQIQERGKKGVSLWLPMFLLWILLLVIAVILSPIFLLVALVAWTRGYGKVFLLFIPMFFSLLWALSGLRVYVESKDKKIQFIAV